MRLLFGTILPATWVGFGLFYAANELIEVITKALTGW